MHTTGFSGINMIALFSKKDFNPNKSAVIVDVVWVDSYIPNPPRLRYKMKCLRIVEPKEWDGEKERLNNEMWAD